LAKHSSHILELARKGAEHKYQELQAELAQLVKNFPDLADAKRAVSRGAAALSRSGRAAVVAVGGEKYLPKLKRRKMSAKARKAISDAQKKRWAAQKSAAAATAPASPKAGKKR
jgi:hypothetical protein